MDLNWEEFIRTKEGYLKILDEVLSMLPKSATGAGDRAIILNPEILHESRRTIVLNFKDMAEKLNRDPAHLAKFLSKESGKPGSVEGERLIIQGRLSNEELRRLLEDPSLFSRIILGFKPYPYQAEFLNDPGKRIIVCSGRQAGKSTSAAVKTIHFAATHSDSTSLIVSATLRQSMLLFEKIVGFIESSILRYSVRRKTRNRIILENGSRIIALPSGSGDTIRGYTADLIVLDEAAFIPEKIIANVVLPMIAATNGYCWLLSTPWDKNHIFYRIWCGEYEGWRRYYLYAPVKALYGLP